MTSTGGPGGAGAKPGRTTSAPARLRSTRTGLRRRGHAHTHAARAQRPAQTRAHAATQATRGHDRAQARTQLRSRGGTDTDTALNNNSPLT